jgi:hypothetical protein
VVPVAVPGRAAGGALKKWIVIVPALALAAFFVLPIPGEQTAEEKLDAFKAVGPLRAGAARVRIELPGQHPVLAGYAGHRQAPDASAPMYVRAIALEVGGRRALIAAVDTLLIPP